MTDNITEEKINRAVLVGLDAGCLTIQNYVSDSIEI